MSEQRELTKIAVAVTGGEVSGHFGHCEQFHIYEVEDIGNVIKSSICHDNPGHKPGFLPVFLHGLGVNVIISGGMGQGAVELFTEKGIAVVLGASGAVESVVQSYIEGQLVSTGSVCDHHH